MYLHPHSHYGYSDSETSTAEAGPSRALYHETDDDQRPHTHQYHRIKEERQFLASHRTQEECPHAWYGLHELRPPAVHGEHNVQSRLYRHDHARWCSHIAHSPNVKIQHPTVTSYLNATNLERLDKEAAKSWKIRINLLDAAERRIDERANDNDLDLPYQRSSESGSGSRASTPEPIPYWQRLYQTLVRRKRGSKSSEIEASDVMSLKESSGRSVSSGKHTDSEIEDEIGNGKAEFGEEPVSWPKKIGRLRMWLLVCWSDSQANTYIYIILVMIRLIFPCIPLYLAARSINCASAHLNIKGDGSTSRAAAQDLCDTFESFFFVTVPMLMSWPRHSVQRWSFNNPIGMRYPRRERRRTTAADNDARRYEIFRGIHDNLAQEINEHEQNQSSLDGESDRLNWDYVNIDSSFMGLDRKYPGMRAEDNCWQLWWQGNWFTQFVVMYYWQPDRYALGRRWSTPSRNAVVAFFAARTGYVLIKVLQARQPPWYQALLHFSKAIALKILCLLAVRYMMSKYDPEKSNSYHWLEFFGYFIFPSFTHNWIHIYIPPLGKRLQGRWWWNPRDPGDSDMPRLDNTDRPVPMNSPWRLIWYKLNRFRENWDAFMAGLMAYISFWNLIYDFWVLWKLKKVESMVEGKGGALALDEMEERERRDGLRRTYSPHDFDEEEGSEDDDGW